MSENNSANKGRGNFLTGLILAAVLGAGILTVGKEFRYQFNVEPIYKGPGVTSVKMLSDYNPFLKGTNGDSKVYVLDSGKPGGNFIIMGGTHPTEPGGLLAAVLFVENAVVTEGKVMVVPHSNNSGFSTCEPGLGHVPYFHITTPSGKVRYFRYGNRGSNPVDQFPDPDMYLHYPSGQNLAADEIRNLDRAHPGNPHGLLTQQIAYAFNRMCWDEGADMIIDHHEAPPEKPLVNAICVHQKGIDLTSEMALMLEEQNIRMRVEISPIPLHGFSHRELGDYTPAIAFLSETPNPSQGSARGVTYEELIIDGKDEVYRHLLEDKLLKVDYKSEGVTLNERTGRNVATDLSLAEIYSDLGEDARNEYGGYPKDLGELKPDAALKIDDATAQRMLAKGPEGERKIVITNMPSYEDIMRNGIGRYLRDADATAEEIEAAKKAAD
ncbi:succinylglutamate desuccinylase [Pyramidobacter piscolens]|uniref:succinylglutamate desuccinylase n=1 Tax=Pyramidobacter piscolens TaxID=638849 RepID=UPI003AB241F8